MSKIRLGMSPLTEHIYAGRLKKNGVEWQAGKQDVTEDFKRCVVLYCSESTEFEVDGMRFKAKCKRVE